MGNSQSAEDGDAMDVDASPRPPQPRLTEFFPPVAGRDPRWNRTQLRSKLPVDILKKIVDFTLGPRCRNRADLVFHDSPCKCPVCYCGCHNTRALARKLSKVSFVFKQLVDRREWHCVSLGGYGAPVHTRHWPKLLDAITQTPDLAEDTLGRVELCDFHLMDTLEESESGDGGADRAAAVRIAESIRMMKRLRRLAIQPYLYSFRDATVSLEAASALAQLQSLQLDDVTFAAGALRSCFGAARGLKILHIEGRVTVDDPAIFEAMADSLPRCLESLTVHARGGAEEEDDDSYEEELSTAMLDWHLMRIVDVVDDLQELDLEHCGQLTDASVAPALAKFGSLRALSLKWCAGVTDASLSELRSSALHELGLDCAAVTDRSIVPVLQKNTGLRRLGLRKTNVSDAIGPHLSALRTSLRDLSVSRTAITWPALRPFVLSKPPKLEQLAISYVAGVDDDAVRCIRDNLDGLQSLRMGECAGITRPEVLLYTTFKLQGTLETICLEGVPIADQDLVAAMDRIAGDSLFFSSRD